MRYSAVRCKLPYRTGTSHETGLNAVDGCIHGCYCTKRSSTPTTALPSAHEAMEPSLRHGYAPFGGDKLLLILLVPEPTIPWVEFSFPH